MRSTTLAAAIGELSDWLEARDIPTVWLTVIPMPVRGGYVQMEPARQAYNDWLMTPGNVWGHRSTAPSSFRIPTGRAGSHPKYWKIVDLFGTPDGIHPADIGYEVMARCAEPAIYEALGVS